MSLEKKGNPINLVYPTQEAISFLKVSDEYLCFMNISGRLWVKSFKRDSLYDICLSSFCKALAKGSMSDLSTGTDIESPQGYVLIESDKLLVQLSKDRFYLLNLDNLTREYFKSPIMLPIKGIYRSNKKIYSYKEELGKEWNIVNRISFNSLDLDSYEIDSNIFEIKKPEDYNTMYVDFYSIDKDDRLNLYISKIKPSLDREGEYDELFDYIVYDLKTRKIISKKENLKKIERYLVR
jgi:hypothetical protein